MKDIKRTPSWPKVASARAAWLKAPQQRKAAASAAYAHAVKQCQNERDGMSTADVRTRRFR
jgi:hypothetical protein